MLSKKFYGIFYVSKVQNTGKMTLKIVEKRTFLSDAKLKCYTPMHGENCADSEYVGPDVWVARCWAVKIIRFL